MDETSFKNGRRRVRCAACGHEWVAFSPESEQVVAKIEESVKNNKRPWILFTGVSICIATTFALLGPVLHILPGLSIGSPTKPEISLEGVSCTPTQHEDKTYMLIKGTLHNTGKKEHPLPALKIHLYSAEAKVDAQGKCTDNCHPIEWNSTPEGPPLKEGEKKSFEIKSPQPILEDVTGCFVEF